MEKVLLFIMLFSLHIFYAQDSLVISEYKKPVEKFFSYKKAIIPIGFIVTGAILKIPSIEDKLQMNAKNIFGENFHTRVDDYTQYVPLIGIFSGRILRLQSKHSYMQIAANTTISSLITGGIITAAKNGFSSLRPDNSAQNSFPSGHSALAFNLATIQFLEYKDSNIWYASSGFLFAAATAIMRVANNRHWSGDIFAGAGTGMAVATIVSYWNPLNSLKKLFSKKSSLIGFPVIEKGGYKIAILININ